MRDNTVWICIHKTNNKFEAEAMKGNIENAGIPCVLLNKQDSSYLAFGYVELHVPEEFVTDVKRLLNENTTNNPD